MYTTPLYAARRANHPTVNSNPNSSALSNTVPVSLSPLRPNLNLSQLSDSSTQGDIRNLPPTQNATSTSNHTSYDEYCPDDLVKLHHENDSNYILDQLCLDINDTWKLGDDECNMHRNCVVAKNEVLSKSSVIHSLSPTVFGAVPFSSKKSNYSIMDTRLLMCANPSCKNSQTKQPKVFHHVCYMHMMSTKSNNDLNHLKIESEQDKLLDYVENRFDMKKIMNDVANDTTQLIFPFCGRRCHKTICNYRKKQDTKKVSDYANSQNWENDGSSTKKSSIQVLIDWITTEENCSSYFGGVDSNGRTDGNRKESYHHYIREQIRKENGT
jgi:hypothetical protein